MKQTFVQKWITGLVAFTVVMVGLFGVNVCIGMTMSTHDHSGHVHTAMDCQNTVSNENCSMDVSDHVNQWQDQLTSLSSGFDILFALYAFGFGLLVLVSLRKLLQQFFHFISESLQRFLFYFRAHPAWSSYQPLHLAFTKGLIHPKIFVA